MKRLFLSLGISLSILIACSSIGLTQDTNPQTTLQVDAGGVLPEALIAKLSDPNFVTRQTAAAALIKLGQKAKPALTRALESDDINIRESAQSLLKQLKPPIVSTLSPEDQATFDQISQMPVKSQLPQVGQLLTRDRIPLIIQLSEEFDAIRSFLYEGELSRINTILLYSIVNGSWDEAQQLIEHPFTRAEAPAISYHYHQVMGRFETFLEEERRYVLQGSKTFRQANDEKPSDANPTEILIQGDFASVAVSKPSDKGQWLKRSKALVAYYRGRGDLAEARAIANLLPASSRNDLLSQIMLESGDWKQILANTVDTSKKIEGDGKIAANAPQKAFLQKMAGDEVGLQASIQRLEEERERAIGADDELAATMARGQLKSIGLSTFNWELIEANTPEDQRENLFDFATALMRNHDAFTALDIPTESEQRMLNFEASIKELKELQQLYREQLKKKDKAYRATQLKLKQQKDQLIALADFLGSLGYVDEMDLYLQQVLANDPSNSSLKTQVVTILRQHGRHETIWKVIETSLPNVQSSPIGHYIFRNRITYASSMLNLIGTYEKDPTRQIEIMARLSNDPLGAPPELDLEFELARLRSASAISPVGYTESYLSSLLMVNGRETESRFYLEEARRMGNAAAMKAQVIRELDAKAYERVAEYYDQRWRVSRAAFDAIMAAYALEKLINQTTAPQRKKELEQKWREAKLAAFVSWSSRSYAVTSAAMEFSNLDLLEVLVPLLITDVYSANGNLIRNNRFLQYLIEAYTDPKSDHHQRGAIEAAIRIYNDLGIDSVTSRSETSWYQMMETMTLALAYAEIEDGKYDQALQRLLECNRFRPMNSSLGQHSIQMFDQCGQTEHGDRLFEAIAKPFGQLFYRYPDAAMHRNNYAWLCATTNRQLTSAKRHVTLALEQQPDNATFLDTLAEIEFRMGNPKRAIELNQKCRQLQPLKRAYQRQQAKFEQMIQSNSTDN